MAKERPRATLQKCKNGTAATRAWVACGACGKESAISRKVRASWRELRAMIARSPAALTGERAMTRTNRLAWLAKIAAGGAGLALAAPLWAQSAQTAPTAMPQSSAGADFAQTAVARDPAASVPEAYRRAPADAYVGVEDAPNAPPSSTAAAEEGAPVYGSYAYGPYYVVPFDRELWLEECRARTRGGGGDGPILGGLLGAITGGVIGNRAWDSERAIGTVLGAGAGGLLGAAIGGAIDSRARRQRFDCEAYLDRYLAAVSQQAPHAPRGPYSAPAPWPGASGAHLGQAPHYGHPHAYPAPPHAYAQPVMMVAVREEIPQRAVVREQVEEEWVAPPTSPASREIPPEQPAPPPAKGKLIPVKP